MSFLKQPLNTAIMSLPLWTHFTPSYAVGLLCSCCKQKGLNIKKYEIEIEFYHHVSDENKTVWIPENTPYWDNPENAEQLFDKYQESFFIPQIKRLQNAGHNVFAFTVNNRSLAFTGEFIRLLKKMIPESYVILGGPTAFSAPEKMIDIDGVDGVCLGEADELFPQFLLDLQENGSPKQYEGFFIRTNDGSVSRSKRVKGPSDIDSLPFPDFSDCNLNLYKDVGALPTNLSRGCLQRCSYCAESPNFGKFRFRSGENLF
ncbi:MAG: hypothetical protein JXR91_16925, partial [Deltaproteobacteria bacterium]|nr:hypothetical protein [Deltaproteobacteria bacterium]